MTPTTKHYAAALLLALAALTACGGSDGGDGEVASVADPDGSGTGQPAENDPVAEAQEFAACLRENGVEVPDPDPETGELDLQAAVGEGGGRDALAEAFEACRELAPEQYAERPEPTEEQLAAMGDFAACMRENGVDMPDPDPVTGLEPGAVDPGAPGFEEASTACQEHLAGMGRG